MSNPHLPTEIWLQICEQIEVKQDWLAFRSTCRYWKEIADSLFSKFIPEWWGAEHWELELDNNRGPSVMDRFLGFATSPQRSRLRSVTLKLQYFGSVFDSTNYIRRKQRYTFRENEMRKFEQQLVKVFGFLSAPDDQGNSVMSPLTVGIKQGNYRARLPRPLPEGVDDYYKCHDSWMVAGGEDAHTDIGLVAPGDDEFVFGKPPRIYPGNKVDKAHYQECKDYYITRLFQALLKAMASSTLEFDTLTIKTERYQEKDDFVAAPCFGLTNEAFRLEWLDEQTKANLVDKLKGITEMCLSLHLSGEDMGRVNDRGDQTIVAQTNRSNFVQDFISLCPALQGLELISQHGSLADEQLLWWLSKPRRRNAPAHAPELFPGNPAVPAISLAGLWVLKLENMMVTPETLKALIQKLPQKFHSLWIRNIELYRHIEPDAEPAPFVNEWQSFWRTVQRTIEVDYEVKSNKRQRAGKTITEISTIKGPQLLRRSRRHYASHPYSGPNYAKGRGDQTTCPDYIVEYPPLWWEPKWDQTADRFETGNQRITVALRNLVVQQDITKWPGTAKDTYVPFGNCP